ncbi:hypothetical protein B0H17DRAFT_1212862 [Mycena rosella]|uniref:Uncharacterized protein n=1 Tax=Mycena rosella TaxID=1033263 RepID=A0AAD7CRM7_MYCRO|nr:hypothetical protein B0H17DRAFT_1212862 [Mycena rosella]
MAVTRLNSTRSSSPTPSENSDLYYKEFDHTSPSPALSQTADVFGWESDDTPAPTDPCDVTPTPQAARASSPLTKPRTAKATKAKKGKEKAKATETVAAEIVAHTNDANDPFLTADIACATAASLSQQMEHDNATAGASSSSRCPTAAPGSPIVPPSSAFLMPISGPAPVPAIVPTAGATVTPPVAVAVPIQPAAVAMPTQHAVSAAMPPMWLTADGLPHCGLYTPTPAGGFDSIVYEPTQLLQGVPPELIQLGGNGDVMRTHGLIRKAIGNFTNVDPTSFTLSTPPTIASSTSSALWLLADIPSWLTQAILSNCVLSSTAITLYPLPYDMPVAGFVGVFTGFTLPNSDASTNTTCNLIRTALRNNSKIREFVHTHRSTYGPVSTSEAWEILLAYIIIQGIDLLVQDTHTVAWRLHVEPPTVDCAEWDQLCRLFGKLQILTLHGTARLQRPFCCRVCPSVDHPAPLCLFPNVPG